MIGAHLVILFSSAGRVLAVDGVRADLPIRQTLGLFWGGLTMLVGVYSVLGSFGDPLAARGPGLVSSDLSISLGGYNLLGGLVLVVTGGLLLLAARGGPRTAARGGPRTAARSAAALAVLAGLSLHAQLGFTDPIIGGTPTSAAYFFAVAVVALFLGAPAHSESPSLGRNTLTR